jgi:endonuclease III
MKRGTFYAGRLAKAYASHRAKVAAPAIPEPIDLLRALALGIVGPACKEENAEQAIDQLLAKMVDWNEVRVSSPSEINKAFDGTVPDGVARSARLVAALQGIFDLENRISLDHLKAMGRREAKQYLENLNGVDEYAVASVLLWGLGGHAIPVNDRLLEALRREDLIHPSANRGEVQAFLERHISAAETKEFCLVMRSFGASEGGAKRRGKTAGRKTRKAAT